MTTAIVTTDPIIGPWNIPSRGQNMIMNQYAREKGIEVDTILPEPLFSRALHTTRWVRSHKGLDRILLCSIHQLDPGKETELIAELAPLEIHFCLEGLSGKGEAFLKRVFEEIRLFGATPTLDYGSVRSYADLRKFLVEGNP